MVKSAPAICNVHSGMRTFRDQAVFLLVGRSEGVEVAILLEIFVYKRRRHLLRGEHRFLYAWLGAACLASWRRMRGCGTADLFTFRRYHAYWLVSPQKYHSGGIRSRTRLVAKVQTSGSAAV